jgi:hypothetical protein
MAWALSEASNPDVRMAVSIFCSSHEANLCEEIIVGHKRKKRAQSSIIFWWIVADVLLLRW